MVNEVQPHNVVEPHMSLAQSLSTSSFLRRHGGTSDALASALDEAVHLYLDELEDEEWISREKRIEKARELHHFQAWLRNLRDPLVEEADRKIRELADEVRSKACMCRSTTELLKALDERGKL